jgi:hypothetical protein
LISLSLSSKQISFLIVLKTISCSLNLGNLHKFGESEVKRS